MIVLALRQATRASQPERFLTLTRPSDTPVVTGVNSRSLSALLLLLIHHIHLLFVLQVVNETKEKSF